jgi:hypothetical protein
VETGEKMAETTKENMVPSFRGKRKLLSITAFAALVTIFSIYSTYTQKYVGASDWYGYYSEAQSFKQGRVSLEVNHNPRQNPSIAPLGYFVGNGKVLPYYPPGYPLLMAFFGFLNLEFYVTPFFSTIGVLLMFLLIKDITRDKYIAILFSLVWAFSPIVIYGSTSVMSDAVAAVFILLSLYLYRKVRISSSALVLGFAFIIRPTNALYCMVFLPKLIKDRQCFKFGSGFAVPSMLYGIYNLLVYGSPLKFGYDHVFDRLTASIVPYHVAFYTIEILEQFTPIIPLLALYALYRYGVKAFMKDKPESLTPPVKSIELANKAADIRFFTAWFIIFFAFYCFWKPGGNEWWWTRFLLPAFPAMFFLAALGVKSILTSLENRNRKITLYARMGFSILAVLITVYYIHYETNYTILWEKDKAKIYYLASKQIEDKVPANGMVGAYELSGSIRLYTDIESFNSLHPASILFISRRLREKVPIYILFEPWYKENKLQQRLFRVFKVSKVESLTMIPGLELYQIKNRRLKVKTRINKD